MAESDLSSEVNAITVLPAATGLSGSESSGDVDLTWTNNDDSTDGGIDVERSTDGFSTVNTVTSGLATTTTSYTDTTVSEGVSYEYRIERNTDHATATSSSTTIVTSIGEMRIESGTTTYRVYVYNTSDVSDDSFRIRLADGTVGAARLIDKSTAKLRLRDDTGTIYGVEIRTV